MRGALVQGHALADFGETQGIVAGAEQVKNGHDTVKALQLVRVTVFRLRRWAGCARRLKLLGPFYNASRCDA
jgi:hypothetical protein